MFIEQLYNSVNSLSEKFEMCNKKVYQASSIHVTNMIIVGRMLAEGKNETKTQCQSSPQIVHNQCSNTMCIYIKCQTLLKE